MLQPVEERNARLGRRRRRITILAWMALADAVLALGGMSLLSGKLGSSALSGLWAAVSRSGQFATSPSPRPSRPVPALRTVAGPEGGLALDATAKAPSTRWRYRLWIDKGSRGRPLALAAQTASPRSVIPDSAAPIHAAGSGR